MSKQMCIAPRRGTGSHKLTNKKDYNIERTRADSLVLRLPFLPCPMLYPPFFLLIFESISSCSMHSIILKLKPYCPDHLLLQSPYLSLYASITWMMSSKKKGSLLWSLHAEIQSWSLPHTFAACCEYAPSRNTFTSASAVPFSPMFCTMLHNGPSPPSEAKPCLPPKSSS